MQIVVQISQELLLHIDINIKPFKIIFHSRQNIIKCQIKDVGEVEK
jgi:hypothetical protein